MTVDLQNLLSLLEPPTHTPFGVFSSSGTQGWGEEGRFQRSGVFRARFEPPAHRNTAWVKEWVHQGTPDLQAGKGGLPES